MQSPAPKSVVVVFAREPVAGHVKTRLAATIGDRAALALYCAFVEDLQVRLKNGPWDLRFAVAGDPDRFATCFGIDPGACFAQSEGDLGARMHAAFVGVLEHASWERCLLVGSDMPHLDAGAVAFADAALAMGEADVVLGPALDGGYYLVAMARPRSIFSGIAWGGATVLAQTQARVAELGLRLKLLEGGFDIDTADDLERLNQWLDGQAAQVLPRTRAVRREFLS